MAAWAARDREKDYIELPEEILTNIEEPGETQEPFKKEPKQGIEDPESIVIGVQNHRHFQ